MTTKATTAAPPSAILDELRFAIGEVVVGQTDLIDRLLLALLCNGHVLIEGVPGLAKTLTVRTLARALDTSFHRIQFTPDLLPGDLIGTLIYNPKTTQFIPHKGPVFANIVLADEINRSPAKVQSALLEAMQERQVTIGNESYPLPDPFLVLATQNPIEQEGTYPLPEAQLDRFMFKLKVDFPSMDEEHEVMRRMARSNPPESVTSVTSMEALLKLRGLIDAVHANEGIERYILKLVDATRHPAAYGLSETADSIRHGASPRASINLLMAARAWAFLQKRDFVLPDDVKAIAPDVLRHRIVLNYRAEASGVNTDAIIDTLLKNVPVPYADDAR